MFFKKKGKKNNKKENPMFMNLSDIDKGYAKYAKNVKVEHIDVGALAAEKMAHVSGLKRLYVICRDNIKLSDAQAIVLHASAKNPLYVSKEVPLVWCAAYPDAMVGKVPLLQLLLGYVDQNEGDAYLNDDSMVIKDEGKYNGYEYLIIALVE